MRTPDQVRYVIRWFQHVDEDGAKKLVALSKFVILGGAEDDEDAKRRFEAWNREHPDPFMGRPGVLGPFLYKTERIL